MLARAWGVSKKLGAHTTLVRSESRTQVRRIRPSAVSSRQGAGWQVKSELLAEIEASSEIN
jgi:hypothetical protein